MEKNNYQRMKIILKILFEFFLIILISIIPMFLFFKVSLQRNLIIYVEQTKDLDLQKIKEYYLLNNAKLINIELKGNRLEIKYEADRYIFPNGIGRVKEAISFFSFSFGFKSFIFLVPLHIVLLLWGGHNFLKIMKNKYNNRKSNFIKGFIIFLPMLIFGYFYGTFIEKFLKIQFNVFEYTFKEINFLGILFVVLLAPIAEEIYFRGYLFNILSKNNGLIFSMICSSAFFALLHFSISLFLYYFIIGCFLAYAYRISGTLILPILLHLLYNFIGIIDSI